MIIELFGISGVGKTTICKELYKKNNLRWPRYHLYEKNNWFIRNLKKLYLNIPFFIKNISWVYKLNNSLKKMNVKPKERITLLFNGCSLKDLQCKCSNNNKYLFDEGTFQFIWSVYLRTNKNVEKNDVLELLYMFSLPDTLYVVTANDSVIYDRLVNRGRKVKILESDNIKNKIKLMREIQDKIIKIYQSEIRNNCIVFINNN